MVEEEGEGGGCNGFVCEGLSKLSLGTYETNI